MSKNLNITSDLENFSEKNPNNLFDFIFSINVLEHVKDIKIHLKKSIVINFIRHLRLLLKYSFYKTALSPFLSLNKASELHDIMEKSD